MEAYPPQYLSPNLPYVLLSGLGQPESASAQRQSQRGTASCPLDHLLSEAGPRLVSELPHIESGIAEQLQAYFFAAARPAADRAGHGEAQRKNTAKLAILVRNIRREYRLPRRKADAPEQLKDISPADGVHSASTVAAPALHSPISPLTPASPLFPDGLMTPTWLSKHQSMLPAAFIFFYAMTADAKLASLQDNLIKNDINQLKRSLSASSHKSRIVVVLLSGQSIVDAPDLDDRLANIRRSTALDPKSSFFFLPAKSSPVELKAFAHTVLDTLRPLCIEYYRDLSKHARRKRNRASIPAPTVPPTQGTSRTLASQGWNVRYEFKLGVLAEFRQEMEAAARNFEAAYETLLGHDVFGSIAAWSPRWNEARLLADVIAVHIIRCMLHHGQTTAAVRKWQLHRHRMRDIVDRRGKGSNNYGWEAWEARWATVMSELLQASSSSLPSLIAVTPSSTSPSPDLATDGNRIYASPEKGIPLGERLLPWELAHHPGYWLNLAAQHLKSRRALALEMPEEDRASPRESATSYAAYDSYLCPEPHEEYPLASSGRQGTQHADLIVGVLQPALDHFRSRSQPRFIERLRFELAKEHMQRRDWTEALQTLRQLWHTMSWRREGWWSLVADVALALRSCAGRVGDAASIASVDWELLSDRFATNTHFTSDVTRCLDGVSGIESKPMIVLRDGHVASFLSVTYAFKARQGHVGEPLSSQLVISSHARDATAAVTLSEVKIAFDGSLGSIVLRHSEADLPTGTDAPQSVQVRLRDAAASGASSPPASPGTMSRRPSFVGETDLSFAPGQTKMIGFSTVLREVGDTSAQTATLSMSADSFDLDYVVSLANQADSADWWSLVDTKPKRQRRIDERGGVIKLLPKPPKMQLSLPQIDKQYYTDETIELMVEMINGEDEETDASLEVHIVGTGDVVPQIVWADNGCRVDDVDADAPGYKVGKLAASAKAATSFSIPASAFAVDYVLDVKVLYRLLSDPDTPVSKTVTVDIAVIGPFEANYDFSPRVHPDPWPSFFSISDDEEGGDDDNDGDGGKRRASGIIQKWCLTTGIASFALEHLVIEDVRLPIVGINGGVECTITKSAADEASTAKTTASEVAPSDVKQVSFTLDVQKQSLEDRRSASLDLALEIAWRRKRADAPSNVTTLAVPRLLVPGGEPRILASARRGASLESAGAGAGALLHLDYTLENASMHVLDFELCMETNEDFAMSGPKLSSLQLVPLSRHTLRFRLFPLVGGGGGKWIQPQLKVVDRYFNKTLRVVCAADGMRMDKKGILVWVDDDL
ncbi:MAG: hypothetical protein M1825_004142 [Sarcosagium campestre]|nr:MAG: hypothetical protein M1825_004142 [Sarcosagium campestre]